MNYFSAHLQCQNLSYYWRNLTQHDKHCLDCMRFTVNSFGPGLGVPTLPVRQGSLCHIFESTWEYMLTPWDFLKECVLPSVISYTFDSFESEHGCITAFTEPELAGLWAALPETSECPQVLQKLLTYSHDSDVITVSVLARSHSLISSVKSLQRLVASFRLSQVASLQNFLFASTLPI